MGVGAQQNKNVGIVHFKECSGEDMEFEGTWMEGD